MEKKRICPLCFGKGTIKRSKGYTEEDRKKARKLYAKGLSLRDVANKMGLKHAQTIKNLIFSRL